MKIKLFKVYVLVVFIASQLNDECDVYNVLDFHSYTFDTSALSVYGLWDGRISQTTVNTV